LDRRFFTPTAWRRKKIRRTSPRARHNFFGWRIPPPVSLEAEIRADLRWPESAKKILAHEGAWFATSRRAAKKGMAAARLGGLHRLARPPDGRLVFPPRAANARRR